ncbi:MetQ/NlpA family ABC transporter substrate-binding protein [Microbacterium amylolyticum]|uniref:Lipoprotein n=1 Tax=Microbacterium amylolyticum TaxID=936337 RepID=A0ABS4ZHT7_9MICO|nr:MetQ/NlpA family ABC transporter substrate-binding protein [Microbacterium amylolyticum]MBP2436839.1 D-methionine transport system substrate-binding protein [Microbacterium amylolyticum]
MRRIVTISAAVAASALVLSSCGAAGGGDQQVGSESDGITTLTVGVSPVPHGTILEFVADELAADADLDITIVSYDDYALPNRALVDGELDANYFQHLPYFESESESQGYELAHFPGVHIEPFALYSNDYDDVSELPDGATIGINNDPSNQGRALDLLAKAGLLTLDPDVEVVQATVGDVVDNPHDLQFIEADAASLARTLDDVDASVINGNFAIEAGLSPTLDGLIAEGGEDSPYANFLAVRAGDETNEAILKLDALLRSDEVRAFIEATWDDGAVVPAF